MIATMDPYCQLQEVTKDQLEILIGLFSNLVLCCHYKYYPLAQKLVQIGPQVAKKWSRTSKLKTGFIPQLHSDGNTGMVCFNKSCGYMEVQSNLS